MYRGIPVLMLKHLQYGKLSIVELSWQNAKFSDSLDYDLFAKVNIHRARDVLHFRGPLLSFNCEQIIDNCEMLCCVCS